MTSIPIPEREGKALDALIVAAFRLQQDLQADRGAPCAPPPELLPEDQAALQALGPDLVQRIISGSYRTSMSAAAESSSINECHWAAGALYRGGSEEDLSEQARKEIEEQLRKLDDDDKNRKKP